jgi:thioredoxin-like negative regulator of GroEL
MKAIEWRNDLQQALVEARSQNKTVLLQFHREQCAGCKKMLRTPIPMPSVQADIERWFIPLKLDILKDREARRQYSAYWTPSFYFLDPRGRAVHSFNGYQNSEDFRVLLRLGKAAVDMPRGRYLQVIDLMDEGLSLFPAHPHAAALLFMSGMAQYILGKDKSAFRGVMTDILRLYPDSPQARMWPWPDDPPQ